MKSRQGIIIASEGLDVESNDYKYDSRYGKVLVNPDPDRNHLKIIERDGGSSFFYDTGEYGTKSEDIITIPHGFEYPPQVYAYIQVRDAPATVSLAIGRYMQNITYLLPSGGTGYMIYYVVQVDSKNVYIVHQTNRNAGTGPVTTIGPEVKLRIKIMITSMRNASRILRR